MVGRGFAKVCVDVSEPRTETTHNSGYYVLVAYPVQTFVMQLPSQSFVAACILWCDWEWWQFRQAAGSLLDPRCEDNHWRHERPGPHLRWETVFVKTYGDFWKRQAASIGWNRERGAFRTKAYELFRIRPFEDRYARRSKSVQKQPKAKRARLIHRVPLEWSPANSDGCRLEVVGDSNLIINWLNGIWRCKYRTYDQRVSLLHDAIERMFVAYSVLPRQDHCDLGRHIYRELNPEADALAGRHSFSYNRLCHDVSFRFYRLFFDGSCNQARSSGGGGWVLYGARRIIDDSPEEWTKIAELSFPLFAGCTVTVAELEACLWGVSYFAAMLADNVEEHLGSWIPLRTNDFELLETSGHLG
jgi:ribonuclease HI